MSSADVAHALVRLRDRATSIKSANAGASWITIEIGLRNRDDLDRVAAAITPALVASSYTVAEADVTCFVHVQSLVFKITLPRLSADRHVQERDFDGVQQFVLLVDCMT